MTRKLELLLHAYELDFFVFLSDFLDDLLGLVSGSDPVLEQIPLFGDLLVSQPDASGPLGGQSDSMMPLLPQLSDTTHHLHGSHRLHPQLSVVLHRSVAALLELESGIHYHLFAPGSPEGLGPGRFTGVVLGLEVFVALGSAESENFAVVTYKLHAVTRVHRRRTEPTLLDTHL